MDSEPQNGHHIRQPFCSQLEERLLLWLEYHPLMVNYARGDIDPEFATRVPAADSTTCPVCEWQAYETRKQASESKGQGDMAVNMEIL